MRAATCQRGVGWALCQSQSSGRPRCFRDGRLFSVRAIRTSGEPAAWQRKRHRNWELHRSSAGSVLPEPPLLFCQWVEIADSEEGETRRPALAGTPVWHSTQMQLAQPSCPASGSETVSEETKTAVTEEMAASASRAADAPATAANTDFECQLCLELLYRYGPRGWSSCAESSVLSTAPDPRTATRSSVGTLYTQASGAGLRPLLLPGLRGGSHREGPQWRPSWT